MKAQTVQKIKRNAAGYAFILPLVLYFLVFQLAPMLIALIISFTNYSLQHLTDYTFVGFENYVELFTNSVKYPRFWSSLKTTFFYILLTVPANIVLSLVVSALLNSKIKGEKFFKTVFYIPSVTVGVAIMVMWQQMLAPDGLINQLFGTEVDFLNDEATALVVFAFMSIWGGLGYNVLIMLSAMKNIDPSLYEAAEIDGAGAVQKFLYITVPGVMPTVFFFLITGLISGFQVLCVRHVLRDAPRKQLCRSFGNVVLPVHHNTRNNFAAVRRAERQTQVVQPPAGKEEGKPCKTSLTRQSSAFPPAAARAQWPKRRRSTRCSCFCALRSWFHICG